MDIGHMAIYYPNIDLSGKICLHLLREDWSPVNTFRNIVYGLIMLFDNPNFADPLPNGKLPSRMEAHQLWLDDSNKFEEIVRRTIQGGLISELNMVF